MPALPWTELRPIEPDHDYVAMASRLPLKSYLAVPGFLRKTMKIRRQLAQTKGLVAYALNARILVKTFWTFSVWQDRDSLQQFAATDPHHDIVEQLRPQMSPTKFDFFTVSGAQLPLGWDQITARVV
jgi:hypothetical protein